MINLFVVGNDTFWDKSPAFFPKERCLCEYISPEYKQKYYNLTPDNLEEVAKYPCIFTYERGYQKDAYIGYIDNISVRSNNVRIDFTLTENRIAFDTFINLSQLLDLGPWELGRTHWTLKDVQLEDLIPYFTTALNPPVVFISYSWTPPQNQETVFELVTKLRKDGIQVIYDVDDLHPGQNINYFMEQALERNDIDNIIVVCSKDYADKANNRQGGVGYEAGIIISEIKSAPMQRRVIPVVVDFAPDGKPYLPIKFKELYYIDLTKDSGYSELVSAIKNYKQSIS